MERSSGGLASALPLAWFRVSFAAVLALDVAALLRDVAFWFPGDRARALAAVGLSLWFVALGALGLGLRTRVAAGVNYAFAVVFLGVLGMPLGYEYHPDGLYLLASLGLLFLPVSEHLALDARGREPRGVTRLQWAYLAFIPSSIYLDSALWKLSSEAWWNGLGFWLPAVWPTAASGPPAWAVEDEWVARGLGYATLAFELAFPVCIWIRRARLPLIAFGCGLHIGIGWLMPLPIFGALMCALLVGLVPAGPGRPAPRRGDVAPRLALAAVVSAFTLSLAEPLRALAAAGPGARDAPQEARLVPRSPAHQRAIVWSYRLLGVRTHPIFLDSAFRDSTLARRLVVVHPDGRTEPVGPVARDRHFTWWMFRATWPLLEPSDVEARLERYVRCFAPDDLPAGARIELQERALDLPVDGWCAGQRERNASAPWRTASTLHTESHTRLLPEAPTRARHRMAADPATGCATPYVWSMLRREFVATGDRLSAIGFGAAPLGGAYGDMTDALAAGAVHRALDLGVNVFDTSPYYGATASEARLGAALEGRRDEVFLVTKCGRYGLDDFDFTAERVTRSIDESLGRLRTDRVDLLLAHDVEFDDPELVLSETLPALLRIKEAGKARAIGVSGYPLAALERMAAEFPLDAVLSYCHGNLMDRSLFDALQPACAARGQAVINASVLHMGVLTAEGPPDWHPAPPEVKEAGRAVARLCAERGASIVDVALRHAAARDGVATTLVGMRTAEEVERNVRALERDASGDAALLAQIEALVAPVLGATWPSGRYPA